MANVYQHPAMRQALARTIRANMELAGMTYRDLCRCIEDRFGIEHHPDTLRNKVNTGALGAQMFLFMMMAMETEKNPIHDVERIFTRIQQDRQNLTKT